MKVDRGRSKRCNRTDRLQP